MPNKGTELKKLIATAPIKKILHMPEDQDNAPHWLYWVFLVITLVAIIIGLWIWLSDTGTLDPYLSYLPDFTKN